MAISISPIGDSFAVEIKGLDIENVTDEDREVLNRAFVEHGLLLLRNTPMTLKQQIDFSHIFGETQLHPAESVRHPDAPEIIILRNSPVAEDHPDADRVDFHLPWHMDLFFTAKPNRGAVLRVVELPPEGGDTGWIDIVKVYAALPDALKRRIDGLQVLHAVQPTRNRKLGGDAEAKQAPKDYNAEANALPEVVHPLVYKHPGTGEPALNTNLMFTEKLLGVSEEESEELLAELQEFATQDRFAYVHQWQPGDVMIWNNLRMAHRAFGCKNKYSRVVHRTTIGGDDAPLEPYRLEQEPA